MVKHRHASDGESAVIAPIHPGEVLQADFLDPFGITQHKLAVEIGVPPRRINEIVHGRRGISADTALGLASDCGTTPRFWMNLQSNYELRVARMKVAEDLERINPRT